jgi:methionine-rich copper-binding protein CopC
MLRHHLIAGLIGLVSLGVAASAQAHAHVERSDPAAGTVLHVSPKAVRITFSEPIMAAFSGAEISDARNHAAPADKAQVEAGRTLAVMLKGPLAPGAYIVHWHAVSADTHRVKGDIRFSVAP